MSDFFGGLMRERGRRGERGCAHAASAARLRGIPAVTYGAYQGASTQLLPLKVAADLRF